MADTRSYHGITIEIRMSSTRGFEADLAGVTVEAANERLLQAIRRQAALRYPGAEINVEIGGDEPKATVTGTDDPRLAQVISDAVRHAALTMKWDLSQGQLPA